MNGASASTVVATISTSPVTHRKMASGVSQRLSESLFHSPRANCAMDPNVLPNTISPRRVLPRVLITRPPHFVRSCFCDCRGALHHASPFGDQNIDLATQECRVPFNHAIDNWFPRQIERCVEQHRYPGAPPVGFQ